MRDLIPHNVSWIKQSVVGFTPTENTVQLDNEQSLHYQQLIVAPGLVLNWDGIKGLKESLGKNGVTSNYSYEHSAYTWELVKGLKKGRAIFTQPPMQLNVLARLRRRSTSPATIGIVPARLKILVSISSMREAFFLASRPMFLRCKATSTSTRQRLISITRSSK